MPEYRERCKRISALVTLAALPLAASSGQSTHSPMPWTVVVAPSAGLVGFTEGRPTLGLVGGYAYVATPRVIVGAQGGSTRSAGTPDVSYAMGTLAYPARAIRKSLVYPYIGVGAGVVHSGLRANHRGAVFGAGVGADRMMGDGTRGLVVGFRGGYLFPRGDANERAVHLALAIGGGMSRPREAEKPPVIVASRGQR
jgi:hypothetical protein